MSVERDSENIQIQWIIGKVAMGGDDGVHFLKNWNITTWKREISILYCIKCNNKARSLDNYNLDFDVVGLTRFLENKYNTSI